MDQKNNKQNQELGIDKKTKKRYINLLVSVYGYDLNKVNQMDDILLEKTLIEEQEQSIKNSKNPNKFWIIKGLPAPKKHKVTTSSKGGWLVVLALVVLLIIVGIVFLILGLSNHNII